MFSTAVTSESGLVPQEDLMLRQQPQRLCSSGFRRRWGNLGEKSDFTDQGELFDFSFKSPNHVNIATDTVDV